MAFEQRPHPCGVLHSCDEIAAKRAAEKWLMSGKAFLGIVAECWPAGQVWEGQPNHLGGVTWLRRA